MWRNYVENGGLRSIEEPAKAEAAVVASAMSDHFTLTRRGARRVALDAAIYVVDRVKRRNALKAL